jgi:hypothetical protein
MARAPPALRSVLQTGVRGWRQHAENPQDEQRVCHPRARKIDFATAGCPRFAGLTETRCAYPCNVALSFSLNRTMRSPILFSCGKTISGIIRTHEISAREKVYVFRKAVDEVRYM